MDRSSESYSSSSFSYSSSTSASASATTGGSAGGNGALNRTYKDFSTNSYQTYTDDKGNTYTSSASSNPTGTTIRDSHRDADGRQTSRATHLDSQGRQLGGPGASQGSDASHRRIEDVSDQDQEKADRLYEERIEDEYAKREGGA